MAWAATERVCWFLASAVHNGRGDLEFRRAVRIEGPRNEEELVVARGIDRSIARSQIMDGGLE